MEPLNMNATNADLSADDNSSVSCMFRHRHDDSWHANNFTMVKGIPNIAPLIVGILGVCLDLPDADTNVILVSHFIQLVFSVPGIVGALLACRVCCLKPLKSSVSIQAGCLALYDAVFLMTVALVSVLRACGIVEGFSLDVLRAVQHLTCWGVAYTVLDITIERCFSLSKPLKAHVICTPCFALKRAVVILIAGVCFTLPNALDSMFDYSLKPNIRSCLEEQPFTTFGLVYTLYISTILLSLLPFFAICIVNVVLVYNLCLFKRNTAAATAARTDNSSRELSRFVLMISAWYIVCLVVPAIFFLVRLTNVHLLNPDILLKFAVAADTLVVLDSSLNFVFYFLFWRQFRQEFLLTFCKQCPTVKVTSSASGTPVPSSGNVHHRHHTQESGLN